MKRICVIISAYDAKELITATIESVLSQILPPNYILELIVGIDGCRKTWEVVRNIRHSSVKYIKMAYNYGPYITFNTLMKFASGDLIARFDADDLMLPGYLFNQIRVFDNLGNVGITRTWSIYTDLDNNPVSVQLPNGIYLSYDGKRCTCSDGQLIVRRQVWNELGGFKPWRCSADTDFIKRAKLSGVEMFEIKDFLFIRKIHNKSLTRSNETGHGSRMRIAYNSIMNRELLNHMAEQNFYVNPTLGYVEEIV